jgi:hypothetical protein
MKCKGYTTLTGQVRMFYEWDMIWEWRGRSQILSSMDAVYSVSEVLGVVCSLYPTTVPTMGNVQKVYDFINMPWSQNFRPCDLLSNPCLSYTDSF